MAVYRQDGWYRAHVAPECVRSRGFVLQSGVDTPVAHQSNSATKRPDGAHALSGLSRGVSRRIRMVLVEGSAPRRLTVASTGSARYHWPDTPQPATPTQRPQSVRMNEPASSLADALTDRYRVERELG